MTRIKCIALLLALLSALVTPLCALAEPSVEDDWLTGDQLVPADEMYSIEEFAETENLPNEWLNVLLLGTDVRDTTQYGDTDSIALLSVNLATKRAKLASFMRDTWVSMDGRSKVGRLSTACEAGGPQLMMRTINEYFGLNIQYYALVNLSGMAEIIDQLGGVELDVTEEECQALNRGLFDLSEASGMERLDKAGAGVHLNGNQAVAYARICRIDNDFQRTQRQRYLLLQLARRLQREDADALVGVIMKLLENVETNMDLTQIMTIAAAGLQINLDAVEQFRIPVDLAYKSSGEGDTLRIHINTDINRRLLQQFIYG